MEETDIDVYNTIYSVEGNEADRVKIEDIKVTAIDSYTYPKDWFDAHPDEKPSITVDAGYTKDLQKWTHMAVTKWDAATLTAEEAVTFVFAAFHEHPEILQSDWVSFGITIGTSGGQCRLADLAKVTVKEDTVSPMEGGPEYSIEIITAYVIAICGVYRFNYTTLMDVYKRTLVDKMNKLLGKRHSEMKFSLNVTKFASWMSSVNYIKMCAFVDMYCNEFPRHIFAKARFGTICTRYKDCTALLTIPYILETLGIDLPRLSVWLWVPSVKKELIRLTKPGQEMNNPRSYAMYFIELQLANKSPYSSMLNNTIHTISHLIGAGRAQKRSVHARYIGSPDYESCAANAAVILYAHGAYTNLQPLFMPQGKGVSGKHTAAEVEDITGKPKSRDPLEWVMYLSTIDFKIDFKLKHAALLTWSKLTETREETIGKVAKTMALSALQSRNPKMTIVAEPKTQIPELSDEEESDAADNDGQPESGDDD